MCIVLQSKLRLDIYLSARLPDVSRSQLQHGIKLGLVTVNGRVHIQSHKNVRPGDVVVCSLPPPPVTTAIPQVVG
jgi:23S rRNA pseudouridine1911/1915/1917 synthase